MQSCTKAVGRLRRRSIPLAVVAAVTAPAAWASLGASSASAAPLSNGNFEAATNADTATNTFPGWTESATANAGNTAVKATTALSGLTSAQLTGTSGQIGTLNQTVDPITGSFNLTYTFAGVDPGGAGTGFRSHQLLLTGTNFGQINLIVIRGSTTSIGSVQVFSTTANAFQSLTNLVDKVNFSPSLAAPVSNTVNITGTVGGAYTVTVNGTSAAAASTFYQGTNPTDFNNVQFTTVNSTTANYVVDNVTLTPEPAAAGLLGVGAAAGLLRRRRQRRA